MKKLIIFLLSAFLIVFAVACSNSNKGEGATETTTSGTTAPEDTDANETTAGDFETNEDGSINMPDITFGN